MRSPAVLLLLSLAAPSTPEPLTFRQAVATGQTRTLPRLLAVTVWSCTDTHPEVYPAQSLRRPQWRLLEEVVEAHEDDHKVGAERYGSCQAANEALRDPMVMLEAEVHAFCKGINRGVRNGWYADRAEGIMDAAMALSGAYRFGLSIAGAHGRLSAVCGSPNPGT